MPTQDHWSAGTNARGSLYKERVTSWLDALDLTDIWRALNPGVKRFTFRRGGQASRLDYWMVSEHLLTSTTIAEITNEPLSDHAYISLQICNSMMRKGLGVWRLDHRSQQ